VKKAGGSGIRKSLQQLESAGLIQMSKPKGRVMTPKGRKLLQEVAGDLSKEMVKTVPELKKYQGE
jgi:small subunit ribosomal protein S19e